MAQTFFSATLNHPLYILTPLKGVPVTPLIPKKGVTDEKGYCSWKDIDYVFLIVLFYLNVFFMTNFIIM